MAVFYRNGYSQTMIIINKVALTLASVCMAYSMRVRAGGVINTCDSSLVELELRGKHELAACHEMN